ncbi:MAG TPA: MaoC family dehydratase N-terminal domain-containing protein [Thermoleophilia bacterium]|nr:MaoC family dehydratase N-terminal domain-containing protein [Thermoleophilia bacterium]
MFVVSSHDEIPAAARALIGVERVRRHEVTVRDIRRFAQAIGATDAIHFDEDYARTTRHGSVVAPPLFCQTMTYDDVSPDLLPPDGSPTELDLPLPAQRTVGGSSDYTVHRLARAGETITVTSRISDIYTRQGRSGPLWMIVVETRFDDADGRPVASEAATYIKRV